MDYDREWKIIMSITATAAILQHTKKCKLIGTILAIIGGGYSICTVVKDMRDYFKEDSD